MVTDRTFYKDESFESPFFPVLGRAVIIGKAAKVWPKNAKGLEKYIAVDGSEIPRPTTVWMVQF